VQRTDTFVTDYFAEVTSRLEAPMRGLFIYREGYFHGMEVLNRLNEDQGLRSESVQPNNRDAR